MSVKIKICGLREENNILSILDLEPDYIGLILVEGSKRFVDSDRLMSLLENKKIANKAVLVLRDMPIEDVLALPLDKVKGIQLHGTLEGPEYISEIKKYFPQSLVFKALGIRSEACFLACGEYGEEVDYFLFDTKLLKSEGEVSGGTGESFDWNLLASYKFQRPYFLSGGIGPHNLSLLRQLAGDDKRLVGVDLNSKYEISPAIKNLDLLKESFKLLKG